MLSIKRNLYKVAFFAAIGLFVTQNTHAQSKSDYVTLNNAGQEIEVLKNPKKVLVFDLSVLETFQELDLPVAGVPNSLPKHLEKYEASEYAKLGSLKQPDIKAIQEFQPDLIISAGRQNAYIDSLSSIAPTVVFNVDNNDFWSSLEQNVLEVASLYGKEDQAKVKLKALKDKAESVQAKSAKDPNKAVTVLHVGNRFMPHGPGARFGFVHDALDIKPAYLESEKSASAQKGSRPAPMALSQINPDYLFIIDRATAINGETKTVEEVLTDDIRNTEAYKNGKVFIVPGQIWYLAGSGLISVDMKIDDINQKLYGN